MEVTHIKHRLKRMVTNQMRLIAVAYMALIILFILGCDMQMAEPVKKVEQKKQTLPDIPLESDRQVTREMVEEYARIHQISDTDTAEFYLTHPDYAESHPYNPTSEDIAFYERSFLEKAYPQFKELAAEKGFMEARRIYLSNPPDGASSRFIGSGRYTSAMRELAASGGQGASTGTLDALLENEPAVINYRKAMKLYKEGQLDDAIENMEIAVKARPESPTLLYNLGMMYMEKGNYADAVQFLKSSLDYIKSTGLTKANLAMYPEVYMGASTNLGLVYARVGMYNEAIAVLKEAIQFRPDDLDANIDLGTVFYAMGDVDKAIEQMKRCIELDPKNASVHNLIGLIYYRKQLHNAALDEFQTAAKLEPDSKQYNYNLGLVLADLGRYDEANQAFSKASGFENGEDTRRIFAEQSAANKVRELYNEGCAAMKSRDLNKAIERLESALKLKPDMAEAHANLGVCYMMRGDRQKQIYHFEEATRLKPGMPDVHYNLGLAYSDAMRYQEAIREFDKAIELNPSLTDAHFKLGTVLYKTRNFADAAAEFQRCVELSPKRFEAYLNLGSCCLKIKDVEGATEGFQKAVQLKPDSAEANYSLGIAYMKSERYGQAYTLFQTALKLNPAHPQARVMMKELEAYLEE